MSLRSLYRGYWSEPWEGMIQPSRIFDQHFGNSYFNRDFYRPMPPPLHLSTRDPFAAPVPVQHHVSPTQTGISEVTNNSKEFKVCLDVQHFKHEEMGIKTRDNRVVIHARHEERPDEHGFIAREFTRQYVLPKDVDPASMAASISKDGILTLRAPKIPLEAPKEFVIPITLDNEDKGDSSDK